MTDARRIELLQQLEALFELEGENAGHELRAEPAVRRVERIETKGEAFAALAADPELLARVCALCGAVRLGWMAARSLNPQAPARPERIECAGCVVVWLLDATAMGEAGSVLLVPAREWCGWPANPTDRHKRALMAFYAG